jgi:hypothetical protein
VLFKKREVVPILPKAVVLNEAFNYVAAKKKPVSKAPPKEKQALRLHIEKENLRTAVRTRLLHNIADAKVAKENAARKKAEDLDAQWATDRAELNRVRITRGFSQLGPLSPKFVKAFEAKLSKPKKPRAVRKPPIAAESPPVVNIRLPEQSAPEDQAVIENLQHVIQTYDRAPYYSHLQTFPDFQNTMLLLKPQVTEALTGHVQYGRWFKKLDKTCLEAIVSVFLV